MQSKGMPVQGQYIQAQPAQGQMMQAQPVQGQFVQGQMMQQPMAMAQPQQIANPLLGGNYMGQFPKTGTCPHCKAVITTAVHPRVSAGTHAACCGLFFLGCSCGCCLVPYCV